MPILSATERIGTLIDEKYAVARMLAEGGMGVVFEATHTWTGRRVALKLLKPDFVDPKRNQRLLVEARAAAALNHPNVVQVLDMGLTDDGVCYLVMELLEGRSLADELAVRGALPAAEALSIVLPLLGAIAVAHARGIVHRDLKPANVFLSGDSAGRRVPKLLDFGIAKIVEQTGVTKPGAVLGTPHYLSPEQAEGQAEVGPAADIWAFGVMLYQCLSAHLPFGSGSASSVIVRVLNDVPAPLRTHAPQVGNALAAAIERALRRDPRARYEDAPSFARALLLTARADGVALPDDPEPLGLPAWKSWLSDSAGGADTTLDRDTPAQDRRDPRDRRDQREPRVRARGARVWISVVLLATIATAVTAYLLTRRAPAMPEPTLPPAAAMPAQPALDMPAPPAHETAAEAAPAAPTTSAAPESATATHAPSMPATDAPRVAAPAATPAAVARGAVTPVSKRSAHIHRGAAQRTKPEEPTSVTAQPSPANSAKKKLMLSW